MSLTTPSDVLLAIARFIKITRLSSNTTVQELAERSGVGTATLSRIEKRGICSTDSLVRVFAALGAQDRLMAALTPEEAGTITELRRLHGTQPRKRARRPV